VRLVLVLFGWTAACSPATPEPVHPNDEGKIIVTDAGDPKQQETYVYVARRPLAIVGLAEARGMDEALARATTDKIADALDTCATEQARQQKLVDGSGRVVAQIGAGGQVEGTKVTFEPGQGIVANGLLCLAAPVRLMTFPPNDGGARGFAIEALWGPGVVNVGKK
jgi:hypothetical protein